MLACNVFQWQTPAIKWNPPPEDKHGCGKKFGRIVAPPSCLIICCLQTRNTFLLIGKQRQDKVQNKGSPNVLHHPLQWQSKRSNFWEEKIFGDSEVHFEGSLTKKVGSNCKSEARMFRESVFFVSKTISFLNLTLLQTWDACSLFLIGRFLLVWNCVALFPLTIFKNSQSIHQTC